MNICSIYQFSKSVLGCLTVAQHCAKIFLLGNANTKESDECRRNGGYLQARGVDSTSTQEAQADLYLRCATERPEGRRNVRCTSQQNQGNDVRSDHFHSTEITKSKLISSAVPQSPVVSQAPSDCVCQHYLVAILSYCHMASQWQRG